MHFRIYHPPRRITKITKIFVFLLFATPLHAVILDRIAAIVNDDVITQSEVASIGRLDLHLSGLPHRENALQERIDHRLVLQQLTRQPPVEVDEQEIQQAFKQYEEKYGGFEALDTFLNSLGMSTDDLEVEIREQITIRQFISFRFRPFVNISLEQVEKYYEEVYKKRLEAEGKTVPSFTDSFDAIQNELIQTQVQERVADWMRELRSSANINVKE